MLGYSGKLLRVDLSAGTVRDEPLPTEDVVRQYLGSLGLGVKILSDEVPPEAGPLAPENRLIFMTGPLTGTPVPASTSCAVVSINADTGFTVGAAFTHGLFASYLKFAGYDGIIVQGAATRPVYLWINDGRCEIRDASKIWGKDTHDTEDLVKQDIGEPRASVAAIGPAGENLLGAACIANDKYHLAAFGGLGAVMGSKKLKAVAVQGRGSVPLANPGAFMKEARVWWQSILEHGPEHDLWQAGITRNWTLYGDGSTLAIKNFLSPALGKKVAEDFVAACQIYPVTPKPCLGCPIACAHKVVITSGPRQGYVATLAGGAEDMEGAAVISGVTEPGSIMWLTDLYDRMGLNTCTLGCAIALAIECSDRGLLTKEKTDGLELTWGDADTVAKLVAKAVAREGFGSILAQGIKKTAEYIGGNAREYAIHVKGIGMRLHDHRGRFPTMLTASICGSVRLAGSPCNPPDYNVSGCAAKVRRVIMKRNLDDSLGTCLFAGRTGTAELPEIIGMLGRVIEGATGWTGLTTEELLAIGERIENLQRVFNMRRGLKAADDLDVSARFLEAPADGICQGKTIGPYLKDLVAEYYRLMGWDTDSGRPLKETLARLDLEAAIPQIW